MKGANNPKDAAENYLLILRGRKVIQQHVFEHTFKVNITRREIVMVIHCTADITSDVSVIKRRFTQRRAIDVTFPNLPRRGGSNDYPQSMF